MTSHKLRFTKMHGAGNDFILVNFWEQSLSLTRQQISWLCNRRYGVGADGFIVLCKPDDANCDVRMLYYNCDGTEAEMCGNGARCFARFAQRCLRLSNPTLRIQTPAGPITARYEAEQVCLEMTPPRDWRAPFPIMVLGQQYYVAYVNTGVPHAVLQHSDLENLDVRTLGSALRHHPEFSPAGANVNFFYCVHDNTILLRTYERGVEDETLACGTGVVATALVAHRYFGVRLPVQVRVRGGDTLRVETSSDGKPLLLGPATFVFEGEVEW